MRSAFFVALSIAASALGISISSPTDGSVYGPTSTIVLTWTSVSSDPSTFEALLIDPTQKITHVLDASVQTSSGSVSLAPPSGGYPIGSNWTINAMGNSGGQSGILAQSGKFDITTTGVANGSGSGAAPTTMNGVGVQTASGGTPTATGSGSETSNVGLNPTITGGAPGAYQMSGILVAMVAIVHAFMF